MCGQTALHRCCCVCVHVSAFPVSTPLGCQESHTRWPLCLPSTAGEWKTAGSRLYSFCSNASGPLNPLAVANLARSKVMIHGMEVGAEIEPRWQNSEYKTWLAAQQLRAMAPEQLQLYTVQIDFARSVYKSGEWFNQHKECVLNATDGYPVMNNASKPTKFPDNIGHCNQKPDIPGRSYPYGGCYVYGFNTKCGREKWTSFITDACEKYDLDGVSMSPCPCRF